MTVIDALERLMVAVFGGIAAAIALFVLMGGIWLMALVLEPSLLLSKVLLLYIPVAGGTLFAVSATFAPERTVDRFGELARWVYRQIEHTWNRWQH